MFNISNDLSEELRKAAAKIQTFSAPPPFRSHFSGLVVITSPYVYETKKRSKEKQRSFWQKLWDTLWDFNPWPYTPLEFYNVRVPAIIYDSQNNQVICHPSLESEIRKAIEGGSYEPTKR